MWHRALTRSSEHTHTHPCAKGERERGGGCVGQVLQSIPSRCVNSNSPSAQEYQAAGDTGKLHLHPCLCTYIHTYMNRNQLLQRSVMPAPEEKSFILQSIFALNCQAGNMGRLHAICSPYGAECQAGNMGKIHYNFHSSMPYTLACLTRVVRSVVSH